jgi:hypothetical protein
MRGGETFDATPTEGFFDYDTSEVRGIKVFKDATK